MILNIQARLLAIIFTLPVLLTVAAPLPTLESRTVSVIVHRHSRSSVGESGGHEAGEGVLARRRRKSAANESKTSPTTAPVTPVAQAPDAPQPQKKHSGLKAKLHKIASGIGKVAKVVDRVNEALPPGVLPPRIEKGMHVVSAITKATGHVPRELVEFDERSDPELVERREEAVYERDWCDDDGFCL